MAMRRLLSTSRALQTRTVGARASSSFPARQASFENRINHIDTIFDDLDKAGSGTITREQWHDAIDNLPETRLRSLSRSVFDTIADQEGTEVKGAITKEDLKHALGIYSSFQLELLKESLSRNELSSSSPETEESGGLLNRLQVTAEVTVSKIFPAGFGWQGMSCVADQAGYEATEIPFFLATGVGDAIGVLVGHTLFYAAKKAAFDDSIDMASTVQTGCLLATGAFHAGTAWQPIVNALHDGLGLSFNQTLVGTLGGCGFMFFVGLRVGRSLLSPMMSHVQGPSYANLKADAGLSVSIGGATACFVGTDVSFATMSGTEVLEQNWLRPVVGIEEGVSDLSGMVSAGTSTALGFTAIQMAQNVAVPKGKNWVD